MAVVELRLNTDKQTKIFEKRRKKLKEDLEFHIKGMSSECES